MLFRFGHATHPSWKEALELVMLQLEGQLQLEQFAPLAKRPFRLGVVYCTEAYAGEVDAMTQVLRRRTGVQRWAGGVASGVCSTGVEYFQEPAVVVMLLELPADSAKLFSGQLPIPKPGTVTASGKNALACALVHIDPLVGQVNDLLEDLQIKIGASEIFGGLMGAVSGCHLADEVLSGGVSGVVFSEGVGIETYMTQGVQLVGSPCTITAARGGFVDELDGQPAFDVLMRLLESDQADSGGTYAAAELLKERFSKGLFVGIVPKAAVQTNHVKRFTASNRPEIDQLQVRAVVGLDPHKRALAIAGRLEEGDQLVFCTRDEASARADLVRLCAEIRDSIDANAPSLNALQAAGFSGISASRRPRGAIYIVCNARGAAQFGNQGVELQLIREQLGDIPLVGFFANGEVFYGCLYGYTGVLLLFF